MTHPQIQTLRLDDIRLDEGFQPRASMQPRIVDDYAEDLARLAPEEFPPLVVFERNGDFWLADGFHRYHAARRVGLESFACEVRRGSRDDAQWFACAANQKHGLRRTNTDKARSVKIALLHPQGANKSDTVIARHVGVTDKTVAKYRKELESTSEIPESTRRIGADGRSTETRDIGNRRDQERSSGVHLSDPRRRRSPDHPSRGRAPALATLSNARSAGEGLSSPELHWGSLDAWLGERIEQEGKKSVWARLQVLLARHGLDSDADAGVASESVVDDSQQLDDTTTDWYDAEL